MHTAAAAAVHYHQGCERVKPVCRGVERRNSGRLCVAAAAVRCASPQPPPFAKIGPTPLFCFVVFLFKKKIVVLTCFLLLVTIKKIVNKLLLFFFLSSG